jgi:hypothetical protein
MINYKKIVTTYKQFKEFHKWGKTGYQAPSPQFIKHAVIARNSIPNATWVETGTYLGQTTEYLSKNALRVVSIEPEPQLYLSAKNYFETFPNVQIINGTSEIVFPELVPTLRNNLCFWLDGHYSGDGTFKGENDTPIIKELKVISDNLHQLNNIVLMIDDIRLFNGNVHIYGSYPPLNYLVEWATDHFFSWHIEQDIFIAKYLKK